MKRNIKKNLIIVLCLFVAGSLFAGIRLRFQKTSLENEGRNRAQLFAQVYMDRIRESLINSATVTKTVEYAIISNNGKLTNYKKIPASMYEYKPYLHNLQIAYRHHVEQIYPKKEDKAEHDPKINKICNYSITHNNITIGGPMPLENNMPGIVIRNPIFIKHNGKRRFLCFVIAIVDVHILMSSVSEALKKNGYDFELQKTDTYHKTYDTLVKEGRSSLKTDVNTSFTFCACK